MLRDELILVDCTDELPLRADHPLRSKKLVIEPVRPWQEPDAYIHWDGDARRATVGYVYTIPNDQKELKQVYVGVEESGKLLCDDAYFLQRPHPDLKSDIFANGQPYSKVRDSGRGATLSRKEQEMLVHLSAWPVADTTLPSARCG